MLRSLDADLVVLQEAPRLLGWRTARALLARRTGLRSATRARACGNLLLVAPHVRVGATSTLLLPRRPGLHRRAVAVAEVTVRGAGFVLAGTHLDLDAAARLDSARRVRAALPAGGLESGHPEAGRVASGHLVLGADVNEEPSCPAWAALSQGLAGGSPGPTFPAARPCRRIDALLTTLPVRSLEVVDVGGASDHRAVLAELGLP